MRDQNIQVKCSRWPDEYTLIGPSVLILELDDAAEKLATSGFMRAWVAAKIREALLEGVVFENTRRIPESWKGRQDGVVAQYRVATKEDVLTAAESVSAAFVSGKANSKRAQEKQYQLCYDNSAGSSYHSLPRQARVTLDILHDAARNPLSEASIEHLLVERAEELKTRQPPMKIFGFYRKPFIEGGHLKEL